MQCLWSLLFTNIKMVLVLIVAIENIVIFVGMKTNIKQKCKPKVIIYKHFLLQSNLTQVIFQQKRILLNILEPVVLYCD